MSWLDLIKERRPIKARSDIPGFAFASVEEPCTATVGELSKEAVALSGDLKRSKTDTFVSKKTLII